MRQTIVVTVLLCVLAIPAALLSNWAPQPKRTAVETVEAVVETARKTRARKPAAPIVAGKPLDDGFLKFAQWLATAARQLKVTQAASRDPVRWVTSAPRMIADTASVLVRSAKAAATMEAQAQPAMVGSIPVTIRSPVLPSGSLPPAEGAAAAQQQPPAMARDETPRGMSTGMQSAPPQQPADAGSAEALYAAGMKTLEGKPSAPGYADAARLLLASAERGHARAALALADLYVQGQGLERNYAAAYMWFDIAARGLPNDGARASAITRRDRMASAMTAEERKTAQAATRKWKPASIAATATPDRTMADAVGDQP